MPRHCAALPGAADELFGSSTAELATALLERLGAGLPAQRDRRSRHSAVLHTPPLHASLTAAPRLPLPSRALSAVAHYPSVLTASVLTAESLGRVAIQAERALRHRAPSRPTLATMSVTAVTAVGAAAAITATGGLAAVNPSTMTQPGVASAALTLVGTSSASSKIPATGAAAAPTAAPLVVAPPAAAAQLTGGRSAAPTVAQAADQPTVRIPKVVGDATATAKALATPRPAARATAAPRTVAVPTHAPPAAVTAPARAPEAAAGAGADTAVVASAMSKLGRPYSWGSVGPNAFDCSGLMVWAFRQIGVSLPRTSAAQSSVGTAVSRADLQPGDLVFFYSPVSHVGLYIGGGKVVNATQSGEPVQVSNLADLPFHNARRV